MPATFSPLTYLLNDIFTSPLWVSANAEPGPGVRIVVDTEAKLLAGNAVWVSKFGNDANPGTFDSPVLTIARANVLAAADVAITCIAIKNDGTYMEMVTAPRAGLTVVGYNGSSIIDGNSGATKGIYSAYPINLRNLTIQNAIQGIDVDGTTGAGRVNGASIVGCTIKNSQTGVYAHGTDNLNIVNSIAHDITVQTGFWIYSSTNPIVRACEAYLCNARGFYNQATTAAKFVDCYAHDQPDTNDYGFESESGSNDALFLRCWATNLFHGFISKTSQRIRFEACVAWANTSSGFYFKNGTNGFVYHCDSYGNLTGILVDDNVGGDPSTGNTIKNSIIAGNSNYQMYVRNGSSSGLVSDYNNIQFGSNNLEGVAKSSLATWQASGYDAHGQSIAPAYATTVYSGFALPGGSALLNAGTNIGGAATPNLGHTGSTYVA